MCGIAGYIGHRAIEMARIEQTLHVMKNRGPDVQKFEYVSGNPKNDSLNVLFLHSRLSIIDLDERANQPFTIGDCTVIFNGEIYNYVELKEDLKRLGVTFCTTSDTEVLLQAYLTYGPDCVKKFEGMWSFSIWDRRRKQLLLSRDRFAEKPLYYYRTEHGLYFSSEIKALKTLSGHSFKVNQKQLLRYLVLGYKSLYKQPETFFEEIQELAYANTMQVDVGLNTRVTNYWQPKVESKEMSLSEAIEGARYHLFESVRIRLRSDVPLAFCLSGGVDSASLVSIAAKQFKCDVATFSIIESDERYDEYDHIMATVQDVGCRHTLIHIPQQQGIARLKKLIEYHDVPVATTTYYVHALLSERISQDGYRVAFSGTAADELYTGYYDHFLLHLNEVRNREDYDDYLRGWQENIEKFVRNPILRAPDLYTKRPNFRDHVFDNHKEFLTWLNPEVVEQVSGAFNEAFFCDFPLRNRMLNELFHEVVPVILHEDDLNSMYYSVENRSPYLDSRLFEFMYSVPIEYLIKNGYGKYILRESVHGVLNNSVRLNRQKKGFNASINSLLDLKSKQTKDELLDAKNPVFGFIQRDKIIHLFEQDALPNHYSKFLFNVINTDFFLQQNQIGMVDV